MPGPLNAGGSKSAAHHSTPAVPAKDSIHWETVVDRLPFGLVVLNPQQEVLHENATCCQLLGFGIRDRGGIEPWLTSLCPDQEHREKVIASWREHVWRNQLTRTFTLKGADQKVREIEFRSSLQEDGGMTLVVQDVTPIRRAEETMRHGKLKFRAIFSNSETGTILVDRTGRIIDANAAFQKQVGVSLNKLRLTPLSDLLPPGDGDEVARSEEELFGKESLRPDETISREVSLRTPSGERRTRLTLCPIGDANGRPTMGIYLFNNGEDRDSIEELSARLRAVARRAQALLDVVPDLILLIDPDLTVSDLSPPPKSWGKMQPAENWKGQAVERIWPVLGGLLKNTSKQVLEERKTVHADLRSSGREFQVTVAGCGEEQIIAVVRQKEAVVETRPASSLDAERGQHRFRNQLQLVTSLFSLEPQDDAARDAFLRWQIRLRSLARASADSAGQATAVVPLLRSIADEVCSLVGCGPGRREVVVTGSDEATVGMEKATAFSLLAGEVMRLVVCEKEPGSGPQLFLDLGAADDGGFRMNARTGPKARFAFSGRAGETEILEVLTKQIQGRLEVPAGVDPRDEWVLVVPPDHG
ncbi:MAG: PAS domain-containing protein [Verrucomicrobiales bacterium]